MGKILLMFVILINLSLVYATYTINIDFADCILYSHVHDLRPTYPFGMFWYDVYFDIGDFDGDSLKDIALLQTYTPYFFHEYYTYNYIYLIWGESVFSPKVTVDNYPYIYKSVEDTLYITEFRAYDLNSDGKDDLLIGLDAKTAHKDTSKLCLVYGRPRTAWVSNVMINDSSGGILTTDFLCLTDFRQFLICNIDEDSSDELISLGSSNQLFTRITGTCMNYGHLCLYNIDDFPTGRLTPGESLYFAVIYSDIYSDFTNPNNYIERISFLGDIDDDGIGDFASHSVNYDARNVLINGYYLIESVNIFWGRAQAAWMNLGADSILNPGTDSLLTRIYGHGYTVAAGGDIDGDGINDLILSDYHPLLSYHEWLSGPWNDTSKIYILFGGPSLDTLKGGIYNIDSLGAIVIKSRFTDDATGILVSVGDINGDGCDDIAVTSTNIGDSGIIYVIFGSEDRNLPTYIQDGQLRIKDNNIINYGDSCFDSLFTINQIKIVDIDNNGLDDIVCINLYAQNFYFNISSWADSNKLLEIGYIFFNKRPEIAHIYPSDTTLRPGDILAFKIAHKFPTAKGSIRLSINADTFDISAPELIYFPPASLLIFSPSIPWDSTKGYWICIQNITDTIGTPPDSLPLCFGFNGATTAVCEPPKPRTLSLTCYPNPFNAEVRIKLRMPDAGDVKIDIYDISGKIIDHIHKSKLTAGWHELVWRPNISVPSGVYLLRVSVGGEVVVRRVVLVK